MQDEGKRIVSVNVRMTENDWAVIEAAARRRWPKARMSRSSVVLSLAMITAEVNGTKEPSPKQKHR